MVFLLNAFYLCAQQQPAFSVTHYTNENGLPQNSADDVELDKNGFLWIATEGGLVRFDGQKFKLYDREHYPILTSNRIPLVCRAKDGSIYFRDEHRYIYTFDTYGQPVAVSDRKLEESVNPPGLRYFKMGVKEVRFVRARDERLLWRLPVPDIDPDQKGGYGNWGGKLYYWSTGGGIGSVDSQQKIRKVKLTGAIGQVTVSAADPIPHKLIQQGDKLYILLGPDIYRAEVSGEDELHCRLELTVGDIPGIRTYRDYPELNLKVVGSLTHGLYLFREKQFRVLTIGTESQSFYPQALYRDSGVITQMGIAFSSRSYDHPLLRHDGGFRSLLRDSRGHYWMNAVYAYEHHIIELDTALRLLKKIPIKDECAGCFREAPDKSIWISSAQGDRIGTLKGDTIQWLSTRLRDKAIAYFLHENNDMIWIAGDKTLLKLNVRTGKEVHFKALESYMIETLYLDPQKILWIGTTGNGFFALKDNKVYPFPLDQKGYLKNTHTFLEDKSGFMWMSSNNGLFRCRKQDLLDYLGKKSRNVYYQYFSKESGFNTNEFNGNCIPSGIILGDGRFSLPSLDGLVQFYPDSIKKESPVYGVFIDQLSVDGKEQALSRPLILEPSFKRLEIALSAPFYGHPDNQILEYNLLGFDNNWYPVKNDRVISLNTLAYGHYVLQLRKKSGFEKGDDRVIIKSLTFTVTPFFYQTWLFRIGLILALCLGVWGFIKARYAYLTAKNRQLGEEVNARTVSLRNANRLKEKMLLMVSHDLQSPLHFLGYLSQLNYDVLQGQQHDKASEISLEIKNTSGKIFSFVEEFKLWARVQDEAYKLRSEAIALHRLLEELLAFFKELCALNGNDMLLQVDERIEVQTNRSLLKAILRNILDNANKNTRNGTITISCILSEEHLGSIVITDTGNGIPAAELQRIERLIAASPGDNSAEPDASLGFQFIADFTSRIGGRLEIQSRKGEGTTIAIKNLQISEKVISGSPIVPEQDKLKQV